MVNRETALLIDDANSSKTTRHWVLMVVCHELAHMWFGNLVTMEWWTHLWFVSSILTISKNVAKYVSWCYRLNEGFATLMQYFASDHCKPEYEIWKDFITHDFLTFVVICVVTGYFKNFIIMEKCKLIFK